MKYSDPRLIEHLAGAYALGTLMVPTRRRFERLCRERADVALAAARWQSRLAPLGQVVAPQRPSPRVWAAIAARTRPAPVRRAWHGLWGIAGAWGVGGVAVGAVLAAVLLWGLAPALLTVEQLALRSGEKLPPSYVGVLSDEQGQARLLVSSLRHGRTLHLKVLTPATAPGAPTQPLLLWALPAQGAAMALGPVPQGGNATLELADTSERLLTQVRTLVAAPPSETSPAEPGPVVLRGPCTKLW